MMYAGQFENTLLFSTTKNFFIYVIIKENMKKNIELWIHVLKQNFIRIFIKAFHYTCNENYSTSSINIFKITASY